MNMFRYRLGLFSGLISVAIHLSVLTVLVPEEKITSKIKKHSKELEEVDSLLAELKALIDEDNKFYEASKTFGTPPWWTKNSQKMILKYYQEKRKRILFKRSKDQDNKVQSFITLSSDQKKEETWFYEKEGSGTLEYKKCPYHNYVGIGVALTGYEDGQEGAQITDVAKGYPADHLGLIPGDIILGIEHKGKFFKTADRVFQPGEEILVLIRRGSQFFEKKTKVVSICHE